MYILWVLCAIYMHIVVLQRGYQSSFSSSYVSLTSPTTFLRCRLELLTASSHNSPKWGAYSGINFHCILWCVRLSGSSGSLTSFLISLAAPTKLVPGSRYVQTTSRKKITILDIITAWQRPFQLCEADLIPTFTTPDRGVPANDDDHLCQYTRQEELVVGVAPVKPRPHVQPHLRLGRSSSEGVAPGPRYRNQSGDDLPNREVGNF